ncbi:hypothetical protein VA596_17600 [Amycolatopsis sp., V23-08]|uniref:DUF3039 domain-containing protein n=1 Tax=Amycolatopsis heterodermiae TaxID=3110235 RepID=A0ABU5R574_9PSEU|nr:hypothetical protein [Amycolatopsis sp., V23-08]MEA5361363.1 hypothetical protein [Amycolatopsis sp., V23-08]
MAAVIHIDPEAIHSVVEGEWHRVRFAGIPESGQGITMLCGLTATAEFRPLADRRAHGVPHQCPSCEVIHRRERGIAPIRIKRSPA